MSRRASRPLALLAALGLCSALGCARQAEMHRAEASREPQQSEAQDVALSAGHRPEPDVSRSSAMRPEPPKPSPFPQAKDPEAFKRPRRVRRTAAPAIRDRRSGR